MAGGWSSLKGSGKAEAFVIAEINPSERVVTFKAAGVGNETAHVEGFVICLLFSLLFCVICSLSGVNCSCLDSSCSTCAFMQVCFFLFICWHSVCV